MKNFIKITILTLILFGVVLIFRNNQTKNKIKTTPRLAGKINTQQDKKDFPISSIVAENLDTPWAIAFLPDHSMLVTERRGRVRHIGADGQLQNPPLLELRKVKEYGEGGLLGIAIHPQFPENHYVYLYYTYSGDGNDTGNRVIRMKYENNQLKNEEIIVDKIPGAIFHDGGRIKFGPDGNLYITTGDSQDPSLAKDKNSLAGKILRVTSEGKPSPGNPFGNSIYSYGHRNPQGISWDNEGNLWETEHGRSNPTGFDEVNLIESGKNYGWDTIQGDEKKDGMETPKINSGSSTTWAPSGAAFINNSLFFAGLKGETLYEATIANNKVSEIKEHLKNEFGRLREVIVGPDGMLYITTSNRDGRGNPGHRDDMIIRVNPYKL